MTAQEHHQRLVDNALEGQQFAQELGIRQLYDCYQIVEYFLASRWPMETAGSPLPDNAAVLGLAWGVGNNLN